MNRTANGPAHNAKIARKLEKGLSLQRTNDLKKAAAVYREILEQSPQHPDAMHLLGMVTHLMGDSGAAIDILRGVIGRYPNFAEAHNSLGNILKEQGEMVEAAACYRKSLEIKPRQVTAHFNLGNCYRDIGNKEKAAACYRRAIEIDPGYAKAHNGLGNILQDEAGNDEALECYRRALEINPSYAESHYGMGCVLRIRGRFDEAAERFEKAISIKPQYAAPYQGLVTQRKARPGDGTAARIQKILDREDLSPEDRTGLNFALGKCFNDMGEFDRAFEHYRVANELKKLERPFDTAGYERHVDRIIEAFTQPLIERKAEFGSTSGLPVFIIGMPRSGTTLVEQILASHPDIAGAGELPLLGRLAEEVPAFVRAGIPYPDYAGRLDAAAVKHLTDGYLGHVTQLAGGAKRLVDKELGNLFRLGLIAILFPRARILHCKRNPMDVGLSCYFQDFQSQRFASDLEQIGRYYRGYERLMAHWEAVLPLPVLHIQYEDVIGEQEAVSRRIVDFCGLPWDDACLSFHETDRSVTTASQWQVRQPVYRSSVERWRRYEKHLGPLKRALGYEG